MQIEGIVVALIGLLGTGITAYATVEAAKISSNKQPKSKRNLSALNVYAYIGAIIAGVIVLTLSFLYFFSGLQMPWHRNIDVGSYANAQYFEKSSSGEILVFIHTPSTNVKYVYINVEDELLRVDKVCGFQKENITHIFGLINLSKPSEYSNDESIVISGDCHINFTVRDTNGGRIGIELFAIYSP